MQELNNEQRSSSIKSSLIKFKVLAALIAVIPIFQFLTKDLQMTYDSDLNSALMSMFSLCGLAVLLLGLFVVENINDKNPLKIVTEIGYFTILFIAAIYSSGTSTSYYKYIFIFLIVIFTIQGGRNYGIALSFMSSLIIFAFDFIYSVDNRTNLHFENDIGLAAMFICVAWALGTYVSIESSYISILEKHSTLDGLTQIYNHRHFHQQIERICSNCLNNGNTVSLLMLDVDHFKPYNDMYGHQEGDNVLKEISSILKKNIPPDCEAYRYGGDEFSVILPGYSKEQALVIGKRLKRLVDERYSRDIENMLHQPISVSVGLAEYNVSEKESYRDLIKRADFALYRTKYLREDDVGVYASILDKYTSDANSGSHMVKNIASLKIFISVIHYRDSYTFSHSERVALYCEKYADYVNMSADDKQTLIFAAYLHDLGKINVEKETLISNQPLSDEQWASLRQHPSDSYEMISKLEGMEDIAKVTLQHHERYDGKGYPARISGEDMHPLAKILAVADSYDAMTQDRPYKNGITTPKAIEEIRRCRGNHFDPEVAEIFISSLESHTGDSYETVALIGN